MLKKLGDMHSSFNYEDVRVDPGDTMMDVNCLLLRSQDEC